VWQAGHASKSITVSCDIDHQMNYSRVKAFGVCDRSNGAVIFFAVERRRFGRVGVDLMSPSGIGYVNMH
jgi:hypothetical protein